MEEEQQPGASLERPEEHESDPESQGAEDVDAQLLLSESRRAIAAVRRKAFELLRSDPRQYDPEGGG